MNECLDCGKKFEDGERVVYLVNAIYRKEAEGQTEDLVIDGGYFVLCKDCGKPIIAKY